MRANLAKVDDADRMDEKGGKRPTQVSSMYQVRALMKKNLKIHMRTNAFPCCPCCGPGQCIPCVVFSGCVVHFCFPIFFVFMVTAIPYFCIQWTMNESDRKEFLEVQVEKPVFPKPYPGWPENFYDTSSAAWHQYGLHGEFSLPSKMAMQNYSWADPERNPPNGVRPLLDTLFLPPALKASQSNYAPNQYSCHCKTLGLVGPSETVNEFTTFLQRHYEAWLAGRNSTNTQIEQTKTQIQSTYALMESRGGMSKWRLLSSQDNSSMVTDELDSGAWQEASASRGENPFSILQDFMDPWVSESTRGKLSEVFDSWNEKLTIGQGRRLQRGKGGEDEERNGDSWSWADCNINAGAYDGPIFRQFGSSDDIDDYIQDTNYGDYEKARTKSSTRDRLCGAIIFENDVRTAGVPEYTIRMNVTGQGNEEMDGVDSSLTEEHTSPDNWDSSRQSFYWYWNSGFLAIQHLMHHFLYETHSPSGNKELLQHEPFFDFLPIGERSEWMFGGVVGGILGLPLTMTLQFGPIVASIAYYVARERMTRQRELMRMMGLGDGALMWSWVLLFVIMNIGVTLFMMILFMIFLFKTSDWFLWWLILFFFANGIVTFGMTMASFVSTDKWAALAALALFFATSWSILAAGSYATTGIKLLLGLLPQNGFMLVAERYWQLEMWKVGATFGTADTDIKYYNISLGTFWLFFGFWFWLFIYYYFDQIVPWHGVGVPRKAWFCCQASYWREVCGRPPLVGEATMVDAGNAMTKPEYIEQENDPHLLQMVQNNQTVMVSNLTKHFSNSAGQKIKAVDGLSFKMYQDECFCLLGHNGAGKTTTMMMLTGCMPQSSGDIKVKGFKIPEQIRVVRSSMGFCPQHNVLWDELSVFEHLELFGSLGGMGRPELEARGDHLLTAVALLDKKHARASSLSGGMKRKLSCALAFLAEPYMVILDEPSSGMDPFARRRMWDTLKSWRSGHIICLTTHYMDEADALGDRIAIMSNGRLACSGTANFLKRTFGCGYVISFAKQDAGDSKDDQIVGIVKSNVGPHVEIMSAAGRELLVQVPFAAAVHFPALFQAIDGMKDSLGIESYGTSVTNLEEVFLKVARHERPAQKKEGGEAMNAEASPMIEGDGANAARERTWGVVCGEFWNQLFALLLRRVKFGLRDKMSCCCEFVTPTVCLLVAVVMMSMAMVFTLPKLELNTMEWNKDVTVSPTVPISLTVAQGSAYSSMSTELMDLWKGRERMDIIEKTDLSQMYPMDSFPQGHILRGLLEEAAFMNATFPQPVSEASQYGAVLYPRASAWCPATTPGVTIVANASAHHALPVLFNAHGEVALAKATQGASTPITKIKISNHPFDKTEYERDSMVRVSGILAACMIMAAYGFIPATVTYYVVMEKEKDVKNQLIISGCGQLAYWMSNFIYDVLWGIIPAASAMIIFHAYGMTAFIEEPGHTSACVIFFTFLPAMTGMAYLFSFLFSKAGNALIFSWIFNLSIGFLGCIIISILLNIDSTHKIGIFVQWLFRFIPTFALGYGFLLTSVNHVRAKANDVGPLAGLGVGGTWCMPEDQVWGEYRDHRHCVYMVGDEFLILMICAFAYITLTVVFDIVSSLPAFKRCCGGGTAFLPPVGSLKDEMVLQEEERVNNVNPQEQFVFVQDLHKVYPNRTYAVKGISFAASEGQVFGLLGVNGAGKTSTFKILCGQVEQTHGTVLIKGINVAMRAPEARRLIGYCPQFDALLDQMTTKEHLQLYGRVKGLKGRALSATVESQLEELDLTQYALSRAGQLSGGNKRKLSVAMATIAEPPMVFLDEPSAGMDPVARRGMWSLIQNIAEKRKKSVVILTTHSMEEAEALCSRIAIQVDGQFRCLGTPQQIKSKYGLGLELNVRLSTPTSKEIVDCAGKLGGNVGDLIDVQTAAQRITASYGEQVTAHLAVRVGSPLTEKRPVSLGLLAEWVLLQERNGNFENFLMKEMNPETGGAPCANVLEKTQNVARYQIVPEALQGRFKSLGSLFKLFQENSKELLIEDFQVCQASLEQIFNRFAATQLAAASQAAQQQAQREQFAAQAAQQAQPASDVANGTPAPEANQESTVVVASVAAVETNKVNVNPVQLGKASEDNV